MPPLPPSQSPPPPPLRHARPASHQRGFALMTVVIAILLTTLASIIAAGQIKRRLDDAAADNTGRYLMQVRGAVVDLQVKYEAWLNNVDTTGAPAGIYPTPPDLGWVGVADAQVARGGVADLVKLNLLPASTQRYPVLGDVIRFALVRQGACPGDTCETSAYVYTCHPISDERSLRQNDTCTPPAGRRSKFSPSLLGQVLLASAGYGGHDALGGANVQGPLLNAPRTWFDFGTQPGHAVLAAGLNATPFNQFVRHGETRPVTLHNTLTVDQTIQSNKGLLLNTAVVPGAACEPEGLYASTADKLLAVCVNKTWFSATDHTITGVFGNLPNNAAVTPLVCPPGLTAWRYVSLQAADVKVTGADVNVAGTVGGTIQGSGSVNAAGSVSVNGSFAGNFQNAGSSFVHVAQSVAVTADRVVITPGDLNARAAVIQGCKS